MAKVKITGHASGTGVVTVTAPNTSTDRTITLPDSTGTILDNTSTLDATKLSGALPALDGSSLTGVADATKLPLAGGTMTGELEIQTAQITGQFDRDSFLRLHPSAHTNSGGFTNMMFGTSTTNNYGVAIGGLRAGTDDAPSFRINMLNDSVNGTTAMTIDTNGKPSFSKGVTPAVQSSASSMELLFDGGSDYGLQIGSTASANATGFLGFHRSTTTSIGSVARNGTGDSVNYNTSSDYRLKENQADITDGITRVKQLQPRRFSWKSDSESTMQDGFIAHEIDAVIPEAVTGVKDAVRTLNKAVVNNEGDIVAFDIEQEDWTTGKSEGTYPSDSTWEASKEQIVPQSMDYGKVTPLLVAALQEAVAKIEALESRITALEA